MYFYDLPKEALNGDWAARANRIRHISLRDSINQLADDSSHIVRAEIISERTCVLYYGLDYPEPRVYSIYRFRVLDVYKGDIVEGEELEILQVKRLRYRLGDFENRQTDINLNFIRMPLSRGDDLIIFLTYRGNPYFLTVDELWSFCRLQGLYYYVSEETRGELDNWYFKSVNEHNNLTFTEADLLHILEMFSAYQPNDES